MKAPITTRKFCIRCGQGSIGCSCHLCASHYLHSLEEQEQRHLQEYGRAEDLGPLDFERLVKDDRGVARTVWQVLMDDAEEEVMEEMPFKADRHGLVQIVYVRGRGSELRRWNWSGDTPIRSLFSDGACSQHLYRLTNTLFAESRSMAPRTERPHSVKNSVA